jgi:hypothetical protein
MKIEELMFTRMQEEYLSRELYRDRGTAGLGWFIFFRKAGPSVYSQHISE